MKLERWSRLTLIALIALALLGALSSARVRAVEFDDDGLIAADEVIDDDVFLSAETVRVDGTVNGNLFASGSTVLINGVVNGNLLVNGGEGKIDGDVNGSAALFGKALSVSGPIAGSIYSLGGSILLHSSGSVGRNLIFTGFGLETRPGSTVGRDLLTAGSQAVIAGCIDRNVSAEVRGLELKGSIGGDLRAQVSEPESARPFTLPWTGAPAVIGSGLRVEDDAQIEGTLTYVSPVEQDEAIKITPGAGIDYQRSGEPEKHPFEQKARKWLRSRVRDFVTLLVIGAMVAWQLPTLLKNSASRARSQPFPAAIRGLGMIILGSIGALILALLILLLGIMLGVITFGKLALAVFILGFSGLILALALFWLTAAYGSKMVVAYMVGNLALERLASDMPVKVIGPLLLGLALYMTLRSIPILGWLIGAATTLVGLGALWMLFRERPASAHQ